MIRVQLDDQGNCYAELVKPGVWHITRMDPFGKKHVVILTSATIQFMAERDRFYDGAVQ